MSIRPIDMQAYVPKVEQLGRQQQHEQDKLQGETQSFLQNLGHEINLKQHQVQTTNKAEEGRIRKDAKDKEERKKKKDKDKKNILEPDKGSILDITT